VSVCGASLAPMSNGDLLARRGREFAQLASRAEPLVGAGWPPEGATFVVRKCLQVALNEEWWHRRDAERDLTALDERT
jgi:hypothetical protein